MLALVAQRPRAVLTLSLSGVDLFRSLAGARFAVAAQGPAFSVAPAMPMRGAASSLRQGFGLAQSPCVALGGGALFRRASFSYGSRPEGPSFPFGSRPERSYFRALPPWLTGLALLAVRGAFAIGLTRLVTEIDLCLSREFRTELVLEQP